MRIITIPFALFIIIDIGCAEDEPLIVVKELTNDGGRITKQYFLNNDQEKLIDAEVIKITSTISGVKPSPTFNPMAGHWPIRFIAKLKNSMSLEDVDKARYKMNAHQYCNYSIMVFNDQSIGLQTYTNEKLYYGVQKDSEIVKKILEGIEDKKVELNSNEPNKNNLKSDF